VELNFSVVYIAYFVRVEDKVRQETSMKQAERISRNRSRTLLHDGLLLGLLFDPEDGDDMFLRRVCRLSPDCTASHPRREVSAYAPL
jgi:hypothetical protein